MATSMQVHVRITNVDKEGSNLKVYAQHESEAATFIEKFLFALREIFETYDLKPKSLNEIKVGLICCAKFEDNKYYRARIDNLDNVTKNNSVLVHFIDHGNTAEVKLIDIRLISKLKKVFQREEDINRAQYLENSPPLAKDFLLMGLPKREWDIRFIEYLNRSLCNEDVHCSISTFQNRRILQILNPEYDPNMFLEKFETETHSKSRLPSERFNITVPPPSVGLLMQQPPPLARPNFAQPPPSLRANLPQSDINTMSGVRHISIPNRSTSINPVARLTAPGVSLKKPELNQPTRPSSSSSQLARSDLLAPGSSYAVFVSHIDDGPHSFAVQIQEEVNGKLTQMMATLNTITPQPITAPLNCGSFCLASYQDNALCRGVITGLSSDKVKVYFIDFGNTEILGHSNIFQIPPEFLALKGMSHRFSLANIKDRVYTDIEKKTFKDLVDNRSDLLMKVTPPEDNKLIQYCELYIHNNKNIKTAIEEMAVAQPLLRYIPQPVPLKGSQEKVYVSFVLNPSRFFVQLEKNSFSLKSLMSMVATHCRTAPLIPLAHLRVGDPCCAQYEDETWYRGEILKITNDNKAFINFVDYGNQDEVELAKLRYIIPEMVQTIKAQAVACCLKGHEMKYDYDEEEANKLEEMILEKNLMMHVLGSTMANVLIVQLLDSNGQDIGEQLAAATTGAHGSLKPVSEPVVNYSPATANDGWEDHSQSTVANNAFEDRRNEARAPSDDKKSWRSRDDERSEGRWNDNAKSERRFNTDDDDKPWNKEGRGRFNNRDDEGGSKFGSRDDNKRFGDRGGKFNEEEKPRFGGGNRFNNEEKPRFGGGNKFDDEEKPRFGGGGGRFNNEEKPRFGGRFNDDEKPKFGGRFNDDEKPRFGGGNRFGDSNREEGGGRFNKTDGNFRRRDDDSGGSRWNKDNEGNSDRGWKPKGSWNDGSGDSTEKFSRGGGFNRDSQGDKGSFRSKPWDKGSGDGFGSSTQKTPKPNTVGGMPQSEVKVGSTQDSQIVYTTSPTEFYIQLTSSFEELNQLMEKIANACESGTVNDMTSITEKAGCLAKYSEDDTWYRAVIEESSFNSAKVLFVDYGNQESVTMDKLKELPEDMTSLPVQAVKCRLFGVPDTAEVDAFSALVDGKTLKTHFIAKNFLSKSFEVVLIDEENGANINTVMGASEEEVTTAVSKLGLTTPTYQQFTPGSALTAQMTWYQSPAQFYLQPLSSHPEFRAMMENMQSVRRSGVVKQNGDLNIGDFVIARFSADKVLYRALVTEIGYAPTVQFVDYGNTESVESGSVWQMETVYATLPVQAFSCCLAGVKPTGEAWPKDGTSPLDLHFDAESFECSIVAESDSQFIVKLTKNGQDVAQSIIDAGLALPSSDGLSSEVDTTLLVGQILPVTILKVDDDCSFSVQPTAEIVELLCLEVAAGEGVKCFFTSLKEDISEEIKAEFKELPVSTSVIVRVDAVLPEGLQVTIYDAEGQLYSLQSCEITSVDKVCPMPILNAHQKLYISHAAEEGIYLQKSAFADILPELLQKLYDFYSELEPVEQEWSIGDFCCAKSVNDEQWYRSRIIETGAEEGTKVQYIDYGNSEIVPVANLQSLDSSFYTPHSLAVKASFHVTWTVPVENLLELAGETEYSAVVLKTDDGWLVELVDASGQSLTDKLVELGFATALENSPFKRVVEGGRFVEGSDIPISVSFIDSPHQIWITVENDIDQIEALQDRLQEAAPKLSTLNEPIGVFAAKFSDDLWYRAIKLDDTTVRFIDYGNSDIVNMGDIKLLSADFLEPAEGFAVKVELPVADFKEGATERLNDLLISQEIETEESTIAHILSVKEYFIVADILKGGKSIVDILVEENLATRLLKVFSGFISHLNSLNDFSVQEVGCEESLETLSNIMLTAESFEPVVEKKEGDIVAALYSEDGLWYRARITKISDVGFDVFFIDYGNSATVTELKLLPSNLEAIPPQSVQCALFMPAGVSEWSELANQKFVELSAEGTTQFDVKVLNEESPALVMLCCNGRSMIEELQPLCEVNEESAPLTESISVDLTNYDKNIYISHVNSANDFYVQLEGVESELEQIREDLADTSSFEKIEKITDDIKGKIVGALFVEDDLWYRAKVTNIQEEEIKVVFVDYGNSALAKDFVKLPESLENKEPIALHCNLAENMTFSEEVNNSFVEMSGGGTVPFLMRILKEGEPNIVSLVFENRLVEKELLSLSLKSEPEVTMTETDIDLAEEASQIPNSNQDASLIKSVYLIQVNSPSDFFLHTSEATQLIEEISEQLTVAEEFPSVNEESLTQGNIVAAQFDEDDLWYRAKVLEHNENETKVLFVDYGNSAKVARTKTLPEKLVGTPPLAMHCSLKKEREGDWSLKSCELFNKLANEEGVSFDLKIVSEGEPFMVELYVNGKNVGDQISVDEENGFANVASKSNEVEGVESASLVKESIEVEYTEKNMSEILVEEDSIKLTNDVVEKESNSPSSVTAINEEVEQPLEDEKKVVLSTLNEKVEQPLHDENNFVSNATETMEPFVADEFIEEQSCKSEIISQSMDNETHDNVTEDANATETTEPFVTDEFVEEQSYKSEIISQSLDNETHDNVTEDAKEIANSLISGVLDTIKEVPSLCQETASDLNITTESHVKEDNGIANESVNDEENKDLGSPKSVNGEVSNKFEEDSEEEKSNKQNQSNLDSPKSINGEVSKIEEDIKEEKNPKTALNTDNKSPSTPRRANIDEHIVPGCITGVKLDESP